MTGTTGPALNLRSFVDTPESWMTITPTNYRNSVLTASEAATAEIEGVCEDTTPPENFTYPYQNLAFAKYIGKIWKTAYENLGMEASLPGITISNSSGSLAEIHEYFGTTVYGQLSRDLF